MEGHHAVDGSVVRFRFDPEKERYESERIEGQVDDDRLEQLEPDLDLLELLPPGEVEVGASWEVDPVALRRFFAAGGDLGFEPAEVVVEMDHAPREILLAGALGSLHELFGRAEEITGKAEASCASEGDAEAGEPARLEIELDLEASADLGDRFQSQLGEDALAEMTHAFRLEGEIEGRLVVLWDVARRHLSSARFEGTVSLAGHLEFPLPLSASEAQPFVGDYELSSEAQVELTID